MGGNEESGAEGDRTLNLSIANAALSQLSYRPLVQPVRFKITSPESERKALVFLLGFCLNVRIDRSSRRKSTPAFW